MSEQGHIPPPDNHQRLGELLDLEENDPRMEKIVEIITSKKQGAVEFNNRGRIRIVAGRTPVGDKIEYVVKLTDGGDGATEDQYKRLTEVARLLTETLHQTVSVNAKKLG